MSRNNEHSRELDCIEKERTFHGQNWNVAHGSYFSDSRVAGPVVSEVRNVLPDGPQVVVDLGGGTGFLLCQLKSALSRAGLRFLNVDASLDQLNACKGKGIETKQCSVLELSRGSICHEDEGVTLVSRSLLHYFGKDGQLLFLSKMRSLQEHGELFVHQPACFATPELNACMNELYSMMGVDKYYMTPSELEDLHCRAGWEILRATDGPPLDLRSEDLALRYHLTPARVEEMCQAIRHYGLDKDGIFVLRPGGFRTDFTYRILTLKAV